MQVPNRTKLQLLTSSIDLSADTIRVAFYDDTTAFTFDPDVHEFVDDILDGGTTAQEMSGTGYSRQTVANQTTTQDDTNDQASFDGDDLTWTGIDAGTIQGAIIYRQVGGDDTTPADDDVIIVLDDADLASLPLATNGSDVIISWDTLGIATLS
ncbi:hypothetical protein [Natrinema sp. DC36]|uniref:hypothetical protein n=1 Tax=Natrinema sp. DC36 TaxID=2878680 RepID=UPI001CF047DB|nr:hypothetical protein [Natrinema sp. DC36]